MASWAKQRKLLYGGIATLVIIGAIAVPAFLYFYKAPTCFDGKKNGDESGIDCGGSCERLCQSAFLSASSAWTRFELIAPGLYNIAAYIVNPNNEGEAKDVPYHMSIFDSKGMLIKELTGNVDIPPHRNTLAFQGSVSTGKSLPSKVLFEFTASPEWKKKKDPLQQVSFSDQNYSEEQSPQSSNFTVSLNNKSIQPVGKMAVFVVLYDKDKNAIGFSKTLVDEIPGNGSVVAPFTWPVSRNGSVISQEVLPVAE